MKSIGMIALFFLTVPHAFAALTPNDVVTPRDNPRATQINGIYEFMQEGEFVPLKGKFNGQFVNNLDEESVRFSKNEPVAFRILSGGRVMISALRTLEEVDTVPSQMIFSQEEFQKMQLQIISEGDENTLNTNYSAYEEDFYAGRGGKVRGRVHLVTRHESHGCLGGNPYRKHGCVDFVKMRTGFCGSFGDGKGAIYALRGAGYHSVSCSNPAVGTVASWGGGWANKGHTGIWNGRCFDYGRKCGDPGHGYHIEGCVAR